MRNCLFSHPPQMAVALTGRVRAKWHIRVFVFLLVASSLTTLAVLPGATVSGSTASAPVLLTRANSTRAIALDSVTGMAEPFSLNEAFAFSSDTRTRVMLFATNLTLLASEDKSAVTAEAE